MPLLARQGGNLWPKNQRLSGYIKEKADFWWSASLGLLLVILNVVFLLLIGLVIPYADYLNPTFVQSFGFLSSENPMALYLQYILLLVLLFFFVGLLRGRATRNLSSAKGVAVRAGLIGAVSLMLLSIVVGFLVGGEDEWYLLVLALNGQFLGIGLSQLLACVGSGILGGLIGSRSRLGTTFWGSVGVGLLLVGLNTAFLLLKFVMVPYLWLGLNLGWLSSTGLDPLTLLNILLFFLVFFLVGLRRGWVTGLDTSAVRISVIACLIGAFFLGVLAVGFSLLLSGDASSNLLNFAAGEALPTSLFQILAGVVGAEAGGLVGGLLRRVRPNTITLLRNRRILVFALACLVIVVLTGGGVLAVLAFAGKGPLASLGTPITEYSVSPPQSALEEIKAGPDGNLWFIEVDFSGDSKIGRITPQGTITEFPLPFSESDPMSITAGPDGNLWFTEYLGRRVGRITPGGSIVEFSLPGDLWPEEITTGPDGNLWFMWTDQIGRITPQGTITAFPLPDSLSGPEGITAGPDGNLWFNDDFGNQIGRMVASHATVIICTKPAGDGEHN